MLKLTYKCEIGPELQERLDEEPDGAQILLRIAAGDCAQLGNRFDLEEGKIVCEGRHTQKLKPGRFFRRLTLELPESRIARLSESLTAPPHYFEVVHGEKLGEAYDESEAMRCWEYHSCMSGHRDYVQLYEDNPREIGLMVCYSRSGEVLGRCLLYCEDGEPCYRSRKIYADCFHTFELIETELQARGIIRTPGPRHKLTKTHFDYYPYLDDFVGVQYGRGLSDSSYDITCDRTDGGYAEEGYSCSCCGERTDPDDMCCVGDELVCSHCYSDNYSTGEDTRGRLYIFADSEGTSVDDLVYDDEWVASTDDQISSETIESDYSDIALIKLSDGTIGTAEELIENGYYLIDDEWYSEATPRSDWAIGDYYGCPISDCIERL